LTRWERVKVAVLGHARNVGESPATSEPGFATI
jgi:hypothetical protein